MLSVCTSESARCISARRVRIAASSTRRALIDVRTRRTIAGATGVTCTRKPPSVSVHVAFVSQPAAPVAHSSMFVHVTIAGVTGVACTSESARCVRTRRVGIAAITSVAHSSMFVHVAPSPEYPVLHAQVNARCNVHVAFVSQLSASVAHRRCSYTSCHRRNTRRCMHK